jgi:hypothetical protein
VSNDGGQTFDTPKNLSSNIGQSQNPEIAVSGNNVYIVWQDNTPGNFETFFSKSTDTGETFSSPINLSNNSGISNFPQISGS